MPLCSECQSEFSRKTEKQRKCDSCLARRKKENANLPGALTPRSGHLPGEGGWVEVVKDVSGEFRPGSRFKIGQFSSTLNQMAWPAGMIVRRGATKMRIMGQAVTVIEENVTEKV